jgi:hypothetical protein
MRADADQLIADCTLSIDARIALHEGMHGTVQDPAAGAPLAARGRAEPGGLFRRPA